MVVWLVLAAVWRAGVGVLLVVMRGLGGIRVVQLDRGKGRHVGPSHVLSRDCSHVGQRIKADDDEIEDGDGCDMDAIWMRDGERCYGSGHEYWRAFELGTILRGKRWWQ